MTKIALCLSGQPRFVEQAFPNIYKTLIEPNNPDVFYHCWHDGESPGKKFVDYNVEWDTKNTYSLDSNSSYEHNVIEKINDLYGKWIKGSVSEPEMNFMDDRLQLKKTLATHAAHYSREYFVNMLHSSWNSILKSNMLKEQYRLTNNIQYDFVIRARFDANLNAKLDLSKFNKLTKEITFLPAWLKTGLPSVITT